MARLFAGMLGKAPHDYGTYAVLRTVLGLGACRKQWYDRPPCKARGKGGCLRVAVEGLGGGGMISLGEGSWKVRLTPQSPLKAVSATS